MSHIPFVPAVPGDIPTYSLEEQTKKLTGILGRQNTGYWPRRFTEQQLQRLQGRDYLPALPVLSLSVGRNESESTGKPGQ